MSTRAPRTTFALTVTACWTAAAIALAQPAAEPAPEPTPATTAEATPELATTAAPAEPASCDPMTFGLEVISEIPGQNLCPKPIDPELAELAARVQNAAVKDARSFYAVLRRLRERYHAAAGWGAAFALGVDTALANAEHKQTPVARFSEARMPDQEIDPVECLWVVGERGFADYGCFVIAGMPAPSAASGVATNTYALPDYGTAYEVWSVLKLTRAALLKLDLPALQSALHRLEQAHDRWQSLRSNGYVQYPWELGISGAFSAYQHYSACFANDPHCTGEEGLDPEPVRLIALHPGVGFGFDGFGVKKAVKLSADSALSLSLELLGFTWYDGDFSDYFGLSAGAVVNDGDFGDPRVGGFMHLSRWLHVGYLFSVARKATRGDATLFVSMDVGSGMGLDFLH